MLRAARLGVVVGMTAAIVGWIAVRYRRRALQRLLRPAASAPRMTTTRAWATPAGTAAIFLLVYRGDVGTLVTPLAPELIGTQQDPFREMAAGAAADIAILILRVVFGAAVRAELVCRGLRFVYLGTQMFVFALVTTWSVRRTGRLWPAIVFHAVHNAVGVFVSVTLA